MPEPLTRKMVMQAPCVIRAAVPPPLGPPALLRSQPSLVPPPLAPPLAIFGSGRSTPPSSGRINSPTRQTLDSSLRLRPLILHHLSQLDCASSVAVLPNGHLVISDTGSHQLLTVASESGRVLSTLVGKNLAPNLRLRGPRGIAVSKTDIFVADCYNCAVRKFAHDGTQLLVTGSYGHADGQLRYPNGLALSSDHGTLFVADSGNTRIVALAATDLAFKFTFLLECPAPPSMRHRANSPMFPMPSQPRQACRPAGLAVFGAELYVVDAFNRRLQVFSTADGAFRRFLVPTFVEGAARGKPLLELPDGVAACEGRLYVTDRRGDAVHVLSAEDGSVVQTIPFLMGRPHGLAGICCDGHRVVVIDEIRNELHVLTCLQADSERKQNAIAAAGGDKLQQATTTRSTPRGSTQRSSSTPRAGATPRTTCMHMLTTTPCAGATPSTSASATPHVSTPRAHSKLPISAPTSAQPDASSSAPSGAAPAPDRPFAASSSRTPRMSDSSCAAAIAPADALPFTSAHMMPRLLTATNTNAEFKFDTSDLTLVGHDLPGNDNRRLGIHTSPRHIDESEAAKLPRDASTSAIAREPSSAQQPTEADCQEGVYGRGSGAHLSAAASMPRVLSRVRVPLPAKPPPPLFPPRLSQRRVAAANKLKLEVIV